MESKEICLSSDKAQKGSPRQLSVSEVAAILTRELRTSGVKYTPRQFNLLVNRHYESQDDVQLAASRFLVFKDLGFGNFGDRLL